MVKVYWLFVVEHQMVNLVLLYLLGLQELLLLQLRTEVKVEREVMDVAVVAVVLALVYQIGCSTYITSLL